MAIGSGPTLATKPTGFFSRTFQALRYRDFRLIWAGAFISTAGVWMQKVAESWLVLEMTGSAFYLGLIAFLADLPILLFSLVGGVVADRFDRRKLLLGSQYVQMSCAFILTALVLVGWLRVWHMLALVFVVGTGQSFGGPAYMALIPGLVKCEDVPNAIALNSIQFNLARTFGPLLAGITLAAAGAAFCFALNGLSFFAVIVSLYLIRATFTPKRRKNRSWRECATVLFCPEPRFALAPERAGLRQHFLRNSPDDAAAGFRQGHFRHGSHRLLQHDGRFRGRGHHRRSAVCRPLAQERPRAAGPAGANRLCPAARYLRPFPEPAAELCGPVPRRRLPDYPVRFHHFSVQMATTEEMRGRVMSILCWLSAAGCPWAVWRSVLWQHRSDLRRRWWWEV